MPTYVAPVKDMQFLLHDVLKISEADIPGYADLDRSFTGAVLDEAAKMAQDVLAPLNAVGDREGCVLENGVVRTPTGFKAAFEALRRGGRMNLTLTVPEVSARTMGELLMLFQLATVYAGALYGVNPLDQPGVELGKQLTYGLLGRSGHEPPVFPEDDGAWSL